MQKKVNFDPTKNGFAFINSWTFTPHEDHEMRQALDSSLHNVQNDAGRPGGGSGAYAAAFGGGQSVGGLGSWADTVLLPAIKKWAGNAAPQNYGLCGGMAATALDYYASGKPLPRGADMNDLPTHATRAGSTLRSYLMRRQIDSMAANFPKMLFWMAMLHIDLPFLRDGPAWLLDRVKEEWQELKGLLDRPSPWPMTLIGTSTSPFHNHQVLAYGYDDPGDGTGTIFIYDMNCPTGEQTLKLDFRGEFLQAQESCADPSRGPLRGFFCNNYTSTIPPELPANTTFSKKH